MATTVVMPKLGQSVESCILVEWKKQVGEQVAADDPLCEVETDKTTMEVPAPIAGTLLAIFYQVGDEVPVMTPLALIGAQWEADGQAGKMTGGQDDTATRRHGDTAIGRGAQSTVQSPSHPFTPSPLHPVTPSPISPRARHLAARKGLDPAPLVGTGPDGRIIERDVEAALAAQPKVTPVAKAMVAEGGYTLPSQGSGPGGWITAGDLQAELRMVKGEGQIVNEELPTPAAPTPDESPLAHSARTAITQSPRAQLPVDETTTIPLKGVRKVIAERMLQSLQTTAQLTMSSSADARALRGYRARLKASPAQWELRSVSINDLLLFAVARTLPAFPALNAHFTGDAIIQHHSVHLGFAVDTPRGLLVPVIRHADRLSLKQLAAESKRLATACQTGKATVDELSGGTFTVSNLGAFGIEHFTPVLNPPQVGILGVGAIGLKAVETPNGIEHLPHLGLSLTINHQVVDGAPAARFFQALGQAIAQIDLLVAG